MTAEAVNEAQEQKPLAELLEQRIELLQEQGLPIEFSSGLLELSDAAENDRERLVMLNSVELLLRARQTSPVPKPMPVNYLSSAKPLIRIPEVSDHDIDEEELDRQIEEIAVPMPDAEEAPTTKAEKFIKQLTGLESLPEGTTLAEIRTFVDELVKLHPVLRGKGGRPTSKTIYTEIRLHLQGLTDGEVAAKLQQYSEAAKLSAKRQSFIRQFHTKGYGPEVLAEMFLGIHRSSEVVEETQNEADRVADIGSRIIAHMAEVKDAPLVLPEQPVNDVTAALVAETTAEVVDESGAPAQPAEPAEPAQPLEEVVAPAEQTADTSLDESDPAWLALKLQELQADGEKRHADGALDAQDIELIYEVKAKHVRRMAHDVIFELTSQGRAREAKHHGRKRPGGQITEHYGQTILNILLPRVAQAREQSSDMS